ncbi:peptidoglycan-binding domain-containing protein [Dyella subtropica]|uniref:peptidoglycan-binding domain-containing protein n=1 Tax=Dyella subtropica TaxID=2992127 RepID=UPI0022542246|nr:peptidoglycan-binding protein [Dyella subtropica]
MAGEQQKWRLGQTSTWFETHGKGVETISSGRHDKGGVSYGAFQLASTSGTVDEYLKQSSYKKDFDGLTPGSKEFGAKWTEPATGPTTKDAFAEDQYDFIKRTHYDVQVSRLKHDGLDFSERGSAVQDTLWSTAVQYRGLTKPVFEKGLKEKFGDHYELSKLSDKDIIEAVQDYKAAHVQTLFSSLPDQWENLRDRAKQEKDDLVQFVDTGIPVDTIARAKAEQVARHSPHSQGQEAHARATLRLDAHGDTVGDLQTQLSQLGYTAPDGRPLKVDKSFGPATHEAVQAFQKANHLTPNGVAGPATMREIEGQLLERANTQAVHPEAPNTHLQCPARLDDPAHPDHALYLQTRAHVYRLDEQQGRTPDQRSDNLASALTVAARADGLHRIDQIALSEDASRLWAAQRPPGVRDHFFDQHTSVGTVAGLNTPMEQSGAQWPQAMQQFRQTQEQTQAQSQTQAQVQDTTQQPSGPVISH